MIKLDWFLKTVQEHFYLEMFSNGENVLYAVLILACVVFICSKINKIIKIVLVLLALFFLCIMAGIIPMGLSPVTDTIIEFFTTIVDWIRDLIEGRGIQALK